MTTDSCLPRPVPKTGSATVYLMEELGDARMRCDQLVRYTAEAVKLIEQSSHRDHFFEVAGHLIQAIPQTVFLLQKALQATALAATRIDYEEIKQDLLPKKVEELERVLEDVRIRHVNRRSEPWTPEQAAKELRAMMAKVQATGSLPRADLMALILGLEFGLKKAAATTTAQALEALAVSLETAQEAPSQLHLATLLRQVLADDLLNPQEQTTMDRTAEETLDGKTAFAGGSEAMVLSILQEMKDSLLVAIRSGNAGRWRVSLLSLGQMVNSLGLVLNHLGNPDGQTKSLALYREVRQTALEMAHGMPEEQPDAGIHSAAWKAEEAKNSAEEEAKQSRFEKGKPADPTENMSPEDAKTWKEEHAKNKDNFKSAAERFAFAAGFAAGFKSGISGTPNEGKSASSQEQWEMASEMLDKGIKHEAFQVIAKSWDEVEDALKEAKKSSDAMKRVGVGRTEDPTLILSKVVPALKEHAEMTGAVVRQLTQRLGHGGAVHFASDEEKKSRFEEGKPADPTENMSPEDAKKWKVEHDKNKDNFKSAAGLPRELKEMQDILKEHGYNPSDAKKLQDEGMGPHELERRIKSTKPGGMGSLEYTHNLKKKAADEAKQSKFEKGKPADPTENMSPEDAKKWKEEHDKNKDNFKSASLSWKADAAR